MENNELSALAKAQKDYLDNFMSGKGVCISLTIEEIKELLLSEELDKDLQIAHGFKFYLRQLLLASTSYMRKLKPLMDMLSEVENKCMDRGNGIKGLWFTLLLKHFMALQHNYTLCQIFKGLVVDDDYCSQLAYDEFQKRGQHRQWIQGKDNLSHRELDL